VNVQELARELGKTTKDFIKELYAINIHVKSGATKLEVDMVEKIKEKLSVTKSDDKSSEKVDNKQVELKERVTVKQLAEVLDVSLSELMKVILSKGLLLNLNSEIEPSMAAELAQDFNIDCKVQEENQDEMREIKNKLDKIEEEEIEQDLSELVERPPVITIMGHVDHGKTLLLDVIRKTNVVGEEAGGITQHIGAYQVKKNDKWLTFLDTPGHAAFTTLRARGAQVTDIAVLVVAADEGMKPQSIEAINHAKAAGVPIIVAINKIDKPNSNIEQCKQQLSQYGLLAEDWGGDVVMVNVSAKTGEGLDTLLDMIILVADMLELKANPKGDAKGVIIESRLSKKKGAIATLLVKTGTLKIGDYFIVGQDSGKIRAMLNERGEHISKAGPGIPVEILGLSEVPGPGQFLEVISSEKELKKRSSKEVVAVNKHKLNTVSGKISLEMLSQKIREGEEKILNLIIKADVNGSLEAISNTISEIDQEEVTVKIMHTATGPITENDIMLAKASGAVVCGFNVGVNPDAQKAALEEKVEIKKYDIIYELIDDIQKTIEGLFKVEFEEVELGRVEVRQLFKFSKVGVIAGCYVTSGKMIKKYKAVLFRDKKEEFVGEISSLKRFKEDVKEVANGFECGIVLDGFTDYKEGDEIVCYESREKNKA
jgi:translation initiation factor IF-2